MKDNFSALAQDYARFRPSYPDGLFSFLYSHLNKFDSAWDVGTGNGQAAVRLAERFGTVLATDISEKQLAEAPAKPNIIYRKQAAEADSGEAEKFDLIVCAQAIHWFRFDDFYAQVRAKLAPGGLFAAIGYGLLQADDPLLNELIADFYGGTLNGYWDPERAHIDSAYRSIPFPFREIPCPLFSSPYEWDISRLCAYLGTWSALAHFRAKNGTDPLPAFREKLLACLPPEKVISLSFPVFVRAGYL